MKGLAHRDMAAPRQRHNSKFGLLNFNLVIFKWFVNFKK